jgi:hypothetical protein
VQEEAGHLPSPPPPAGDHTLLQWASTSHRLQPRQPGITLACREGLGDQDGRHFPPLLQEKGARAERPCPAQSSPGPAHSSSPYRFGRSAPRLGLEPWPQAIHYRLVQGEGVSTPPHPWGSHSSKHRAEWASTSGDGIDPLPLFWAWPSPLCHPRNEVRSSLPSDSNNGEVRAVTHIVLATTL